MILLEPEQTAYDWRFQLLGIPVRVHPMFWLVSAIMGWSAMRAGIAFVLLWIGCVFVSVLIHELGHVLMGRWFGRYGHIILYGFGGLAVGSSGMYSRWQRIAVYFAGPLAGFIFLGVVLLGLLVANYDLFHLYLLQMCMLLNIPFDEAALIRLLMQRDRSPYLEEVVWNLFQINLFWGLLNLLPIYPLDGGQITRDFLPWLTPANGIRLAHGIGFTLAALLAAHALLAQAGQPLLPLPIGGVWMGILFGMLAIQNWQMMQQRPILPDDPWGDERRPWER